MSNFTPHGWHTVTPRIVTGDVAGLIGFLKAVFNATGEYRVGMPAEIMIGDSQHPIPAKWNVCSGDRGFARISGCGGRNTRFLRLVERAIPRLAA